MGVHDMDKYDEVRKLLGIPADEPIFIIRAQDRYAPVAVEDYVHTVYRGERGADGFASGELRLWRYRGQEHADSFYEWQELHSDQVKSPD